MAENLSKPSEPAECEQLKVGGCTLSSSPPDGDIWCRPGPVLAGAAPRWDVIPWLQWILERGLICGNKHQNEHSCDLFMQKWLKIQRLT